MADNETPPAIINGMPVVAVCEMCGRPFLTLPADRVMRDHYKAGGTRENRYRGRNDLGPCNGRLRLTDAGRRMLEGDANA